MFMAREKTHHHLLLFFKAASHKAPDGTRFIGGVQLSLITQEGEIVLVDIK